MKPRRDITLGEMQDECRRHGDCGKCDVKTLCVHYLEKPYTSIDLTDPPRFTEAQMALLRGFRGIGAKSVQESSGWFCALDKNGMQINIARSLNLCGETLDLAELLEKDGDK